MKARGKYKKRYAFLEHPYFKLLLCSACMMLICLLVFWHFVGFPCAYLESVPRVEVLHIEKRMEVGESAWIYEGQITDPNTIDKIYKFFNSNTSVLDTHDYMKNRVVFKFDDKELAIEFDREHFYVDGHLGYINK